MTKTPVRIAVFDLICMERDRQDEKWQRSDGIWEEPDYKKLAVLVEEVGEVARAIMEGEPKSALLAEIIQVAASSTAWAESMLVKKPGGPSE